MFTMHNYSRLKKITVFLLFVLSCNPVFPDSTPKEGRYGWIGKSKSSDNSIIVLLIDQLDFTERIEVLNILAERSDRDYREICDYILLSGSMKSDEREYLLYLIAEKLLPAENENPVIKEQYYLIADGIASYKGSYLRKKIIEKSFLAEGSRRESILLREAVFLLEKVAENNLPDEEILQECRLFFRIAGNISNLLDDYIEQIYQKAVNMPYSFKNF